MKKALVTHFYVSFNSCNILIVVIVEFELLNQCAWPYVRLKVHAVPMDHNTELKDIYLGSRC